MRTPSAIATRVLAEACTHDGNGRYAPNTWQRPEIIDDQVTEDARKSAGQQDRFFHVTYRVRQNTRAGDYPHAWTTIKMQLRYDVSYYSQGWAKAWVWGETGWVEVAQIMGLHLSIMDPDEHKRRSREPATPQSVMESAYIADVRRLHAIVLTTIGF